MFLAKILGDCERLFITSGRELCHVLNSVAVVEEINTVLHQDATSSARFVMTASL